MATKEGVKLFKLAAQLNIGKDTIVEFLQTKGITVENKPMSNLTDDMVGMLMDHFQREHVAAQKHRQKVEQHKQLVREIASSQRDAVSMHKEVPEPVSVEPVLAPPIAVEVVPEPVVVPPPVAVEEPVAEKPEIREELVDAIPVGTVIALDQFDSRRKKKIGKDEPTVAEAVTEVPVIVETVAEIPAVVAETPKVVEAVAEIPAVVAETPKVVETVEEIPVVVAETPKVVETVEEIPATEVQAEESSSEAETHEGENAEDDHHEDGSRRRKKKKKIAEIQYQTVGGVPQLPGLTILGKIDLSPKKKAATPPPPAPSRNERRDRDHRGKDSRKEKYSPEDAAKRKAAAAEKIPEGDWIPRDKNAPATTSGKPKDKDKENKDNKEVKKPKTTTSPVITTPKPPAGSESAEAKKAKKRKKNKFEKVSSVEVDKAIRRTLSGMDDSSVASRSKMRQKRRFERDEQRRADNEAILEDRTLTVTEFITVGELANLIGVDVGQIILKCMQLGLMVSINQRLEKDSISLIADDFGFTVEFETEFSPDSIEDEEDDETDLQPRAPIVTIMGHVDHGKTSLLDHIRSANVVAGESGGITQHIGAYRVILPSGKAITFLDTPGHQAFTAMRARGAQVTDLVVLVVAADDSVMPQTIEAISHARAANVPIVVAINKIDKVDARPDRIKQQLADHGVLVEDWGGKNQSVEISARKGINVDVLLEKILLEAELLNLQANPDRMARGIVIESKIDKGKGPVSTIIVQKGTLEVGDPFISGVHAGRVRALLDERGNRIERAEPATPVQVLGFDGPPTAGDTFIVMESESEVRQIAIKRQQIKREQQFKQVRHVTLDDISQQIKIGGVQELKIILKADADGSMEALTDSLQKLSTAEVKVVVIHRGVGAITESDIMLAAASDAIVIGFHIRPTLQAKKLADAEAVDVRIYSIIYNCIDEIRAALEGMLNPEIKEEVAAMVEIREVFKISKIGTIAGCYVLEGKINRNDPIRIIRDGFDIYSGKIASLKRIKDDVREVDTGYECGIGIENFNDLKVGDIIEAVKTTEVKRKL